MMNRMFGRSSAAAASEQKAAKEAMRKRRNERMVCLGVWKGYFKLDSSLTGCNAEINDREIDRARPSPLTKHGTPTVPPNSDGTSQSSAAFPKAGIRRSGSRGWR